VENATDDVPQGDDIAEQDIAEDDIAESDAPKDETSETDTDTSDTSAGGSDESAEDDGASASSASPETPDADEVRLNHIQVIGSHNSYHLKPRAEIFDALTALAPELASEIEYSHKPLAEQLGTYGIRQFEIDVFADPDGGRFANYAAHTLVGLEAASGDPLLDEPGFKVMHTQDFDYATTCVTLINCLSEIQDWSAANPNHLPIMVMIEIKDTSIEDAGADAGLDLSAFDVVWSPPAETTPEVLDDLDAEIRSLFSESQLITPDDVRGDADTLEAAVTTDGWPTVAASRGQVLFTMTNGGDIREQYIDGNPNLEGRPIFTSSTPGDPDAAFVRFDDPTDPELDEAAMAGYLIRTRTDSPTADARDNDTSRLTEALASGANFLSTDYYAPSEFFDSPYVARLPNEAIARCNPVTAPPTCSDADLTE